MDKTKQIMALVDRWCRMRNIVADALPNTRVERLDEITNAMIEAGIREILKEGE